MVCMYACLSVCLSTEPNDVRLMGGTNKCSGTLEMKHQRLWRPVEERRGWNRMSSAVVCRQLGCGSAVSTHRTYGSTYQTMWSYSLFLSTCVGSESLLEECGRIEPGNFTEAVEVICSGTAIFTVSYFICQTQCLSVCDLFQNNFKIGPNREVIGELSQRGDCSSGKDHGCL